MEYGNMPLEGGFLKIDEHEKDALFNENSDSLSYIRPLIGGEEMLDSIKRYCIWIDDNVLNEARKIHSINQRIENVYNFRVNGGDVAKTLTQKSHQFRYRKTAKESFIAIPCTTSIRRDYMQCGFFGSEFISSNSLQIIYDSEPYIFSVISSKIHLIWVRTVGGRLKEDIRYSTQLCYNTFPFPIISNQLKEELTHCTFRILEERENHSEKTLAQLYDPEKMPKGLREAHRLNDLAVERCYRSKPFESDEERLEYLFKLYEQMIEEEKSRGTLFGVENKPKRKKK